MLEQLYFTWSTIGLGDVPGFRVRAASAAISNINGERYNALKAYLNYNLPQGTDAYAADATLNRTPIGMVYADTGKEHIKEHIIAQKVYKGRDKYNRPGVYFVHLLADLPQDFLARDAIDLWKSRSWVTEVPDEHPVTLQQVGLDSFKRWPGTLSERDIASGQQYLPLLIQAYLTLGETQRIYIAAPNSQLAALIWGLTHSLPRILQQTLTFSTYEQDVTKSTVRIACTSTPDEDLFLKGYARSAQILPAECFTGKGIAIDCYSGKTSDLKYVSQEVVDYSLYATNCLIQGRKKELDDLLDTADRLEAKSTDEFLAVYSGDQISTEREVTGLLKNKKLATALLHKEKVKSTIIDLAIANPQWWDGEAAPALKKLRPEFANPQDKQGVKEREALTALGIQAAQALCATMLHNQTQSSEILMRVLYNITPPDKDVGPWLQLLQSFSTYMVQEKQFHPAKAFSWDFRAWLLQQWAFGYQYISDELILPWLQLNWNDFINLLALPNIPGKWHQLALIQLLSHSKEPLPKQVVKLFSNPQYQTLCIGALKELMRYAQTQPAAQHCFQTLVEYGYGNKISLLVSLLDTKVAGDKNILTPERLNDFLRATKLKDREKIEFLEERGSLLLGAGHRELAPALVDIITVYVSKFTVEQLLDQSAQATLRTLDLLGKQLNKLPPNVAEHLKAWIYVSYGIVHNPFVPFPLEKKALTTAGTYIIQLKLQNHKKYRESLFFVLINTIKTNTELRSVYESLVPALADRKLDLLFDLAAFLGERYTSRLSYELLLPYVYEALAWAATMKSAENKADFLTDIFKALLKHVNSDVFEKITYEVATWSKDYLRDWRAYAVPPESKSLLQKVGDVGGNVVGSVVGGAKAIGGAIGGGRGNDDGRAQERPSSETPQEEQTPPQGRNGYGSAHNQQNVITSSGDKTTPKMPYNPNDYQQQSGQPPVNPVPQQQNLPPVYEQTQVTPYVQQASGASQYTQSVPEQAQMYSMPQQEPPQSIVNGQPIYPKWIVTVYKLKGPYIEYRENELKKEFVEHQKKKWNIEWIGDEQSLIRSLFSVADSLKLLEMDVLIQNGILHFSAAPGGSQLDPQLLLGKVYQDLHKKYQGYSEEEVKNVLLVFVRYRVLSEYFRKQNPPVRLRHWLEKQWLAAEDQGRIDRSLKPLPDGK